MLEGLLVDLVPASKSAYFDKKHKWENGEAAFWGSAGGRPILTRAMLERWHAEHVARMEHSQRVTFGIQTKDGQPIGDISMNWVLPHHRLSILGAQIGEPEFWGGGYGTDALLLLTDYAFDWLDMHKLWLGTMGINVRVHRQMEKVGFQREAVRRDLFYADGQWTDEVIYGILREEWPGRAAVIERIGLQARKSSVT